MQVEIWSDIVCPFCYIGKRNFEKALDQFDGRDKVSVVWKSFELAPQMKTEPDESIYDVLALRKGWTPEQSRQIHREMEERAQASGLTYNFEETVPANSKRAHRLLHLAKENAVQNEVKEKLFAAYFTHGVNIDDIGELIRIGTSAGLSEEKIREAVSSETLNKEIHKDIEAAQQIGVQGVPFFVFNNRYAVSGAREPEAFLNVLKKAASTSQA